MEKRKLLFVLMVFFAVFISSSYLVSSVEFSVQDSYDQEETLIAKISGYFEEPILKENIVFYKYYDGSEVYTSLDFELLQIKEDYYLYAQLDKDEGNYSVKIEDVKDETIRRNFTILDKTAEFYVDPGVVKTETDFKIELTNLLPDSITININPENESTGFFSFSSSTESERQITLDPEEPREVDFELENKTGLKTITMSSNSTNYEIPVYSIVKNDSVSTSQNETNESINQTDNETQKNYFSQKRFEKIIIPGNKIQKEFTITNSEDIEMKNISLKLSSNLENYVNLTKEFIDSLESGESTEFGMTIFSDETKKVRGNLTFNSVSEDETNYSSVMELSFDFTNESSPVENETNENQSGGATYTKTCEELGGQKCNSSEICTGQQPEASDGECCLGKCELKEEDNKGKVVGWTIVIIVVLFLIWFYLVRYKGIKSKINIMDVARGKKKEKKSQDN